MIKIFLGLVIYRFPSFSSQDKSEALTFFEVVGIESMILGKGRTIESPKETLMNFSALK